MFYHYIYSSLRSAKKNRLFYSINLIGFLSGFLLLTIILTFVYQELSFDRFHKNAANIYRIHSGGYGVTPLCFGEKLKNQIPEITGIVRFSLKDLTIKNNNQEVEISKTYYTDAEIFKVFSFKLLSGNPANVLNDPFSIVINRTIANKLFGNRSPIGKTIRDKDGTIYTITGIMEDIPYNSHVQASAFISIETLRHTGDDAFNCGAWGSLTYLSISEKANIKETEAKINSILKDSRMETSEGKIILNLQPLKKVYFDYKNNKYDGTKHGNLQTVFMYLAISILILFIVMVNYINLSTAISGSRIKEIAIRKVNGAGRIQIIKQILFETLGVVFISFIIALSIIELLLPQLSGLLNLSIDTSLNRSSLYCYYFIGIVVIGIIVGLISGIFFSKINVIKTLKNESVLSSRGTQRKILLVFQLVIVAVLLNSTFIIKKQIGFVFKKDLGFQYENVISFGLNKTLQDKNEILKDILLKNPRVESISFSDGLLGDGFCKSSIKIGAVEKLCYFNSIDPYYLALYKIKLKEGRCFSNDLKTDSNKSCIINEETCNVYGIKNPVGKSIGHKIIVGVVYNFNYTSLHNKIEPLVFYCGKGRMIQIKISAVNKEETIEFIKNACKGLSPDFELNISFLKDHIKKLYKSELDLKSSFSIYSIITCIIALLGLFGLTLFKIKKKTKEISIRKLFGAKLNNTFILLAKEEIRIVLISNILAIPITLLLMNKWLNNFQFRVDIGFLIFLKTFLVSVAFTLLAILFLIIKTHKTKLIETLKYE